MGVIEKVKRSDKKVAFIKDGKVLGDMWFEKCGDFIDGFAVVKFGKKEYGFIDENGNVSERFRYATPFKGGFACVSREDKRWNLIGVDMKPIAKEWFDCVYDFNEGFAIVRRCEGKYGYMDKDGNILGDMWFPLAYDFSNGFGLVRTDNDLYAYMSKDGNMIYANDFR